MDSITQMLFGAVVGQAGFHRRLGNKALVAGALIASIPDMDVVAGWVGDSFTSMEHHRGLTHSFLFAPVIGPLIGLALAKWHAGRPAVAGQAMPGSADARNAWIWLAILALITHPLIDAFTSYGTQLLYPVSTARFAVNSMSIIDPIYSLTLVAVLLVGVVVRGRPAVTQNVAGYGLILIAIYTMGGWALNERVILIARAQFGPAATINAYPTLFQPVYRRVVITQPDQVLVGYHSVLNPKPIDWRRYAVERGPAIDAVLQTREGRLFAWFSMGHLLWRTAPGPNGATIVSATDIRYGLPGATETGFWGIRATVDPALRVTGPVERFGIPREASSDQLTQFWSDITGR